MSISSILWYDDIINLHDCESEHCKLFWFIIVNEVLLTRILFPYLSSSWSFFYGYIQTSSSTTLEAVMFEQRLENY